MRLSRTTERTLAAIRRAARTLAASAMALICATACVHEFPDIDTPASFVLKLRFNIDIDVNVEMDMSADINTGFGADVKSQTKVLTSETHDLRYIVKFFRIVNGEMMTYPAYEHLFTTDDINVHTFTEELEIAEGHYRIYVWGDYVRQGDKMDYHYDTGAFPRIGMNLPENTTTYTGSLDSRDAYVGYTDINVVRFGRSEKPVEASIEIHRPLAKFVVISNDLEEFVTKVTQMRANELKEMVSSGAMTKAEAQEIETKAVDLEEFKVMFHFQGDENTMYNAPVAFDVFADKPVATAQGLNFTSTITRVMNENTGKMEARLGFDYIFVNGTETHTRVVVGVYNKDDEKLKEPVALTKSIKIPIRRNQQTTVRGGFLMQNVEGGVAINPGFDGPDYDYIIK